MPGPVIEPGDYVAVYRGRASARFLNDEGIAFSTKDEEDRLIHFQIYTRYVGEGLAYPTPRELVIEASGRAESADDLLHRANATARAVAISLAFIANAAVEDIEAHLAFDNTAGRSQRSFVEVHVPDETGMVRQGRKIPLPEGFETLGQIFSLGEETDYVRRAIANYALALERWYIGGETLVLASLYVAAENLDKAVVIAQARDAGMTVEQYAKSQGLGLRKLQAKFRREVIFRNDEEAYELAKDAVDGFEHGSMDLGEVLRRAQEACPKVFDYIRSAIIDLVGVDPGIRDLLLGERYGQPLDAQSMRTLVRGRFENVGDELAAADERYPLLTWTRGLARLELGDDRQLSASIKENMTVKCADGVQFRHLGIEVHGRRQPGMEPRELQVEELRSTAGPGDVNTEGEDPQSSST
jgi:hypothetical protein